MSRRKPSMTLSGFDALNKRLDALAVDLRGDAMRGAVRKGALAVLPYIKAAAPHSGQNTANARKYKSLRDNIRVTIQKDDIGEDYATAHIHTGDAFWGLFQEFGTTPYRNKRSGKTQGGQPPRPWFTPAWNAHNEEAIKPIADELTKYLARIAKRK